RALRQVDVIQRMQMLVLASLVAEALERAVADHLIGIHVARGARAALDDVDDELLVQLSLADFLAGEADRDRTLVVDQAELAVGDRRGLLHARQRRHQVRIDRYRRAGDRKILQRAQRMDAVVRVGRHYPVAEEVVLGPHRLGHGAILALSCGLMADDLDFSAPAGPPKPAATPKPAAAAQAPLYIPAVARAFFESAGKEEDVAAGTVFFSENEKASRLLLKRDKMYFLLEGAVALVAKGRTIGEPKVGEIFGEMAAISDSPRSATALAKSACRVISLDDKGFAAALSKKPEFALMMLGTMIMRLRGMIARLSGIPSTAEMKDSRVFDKNLLNQMIQGLGDQAVVRYEKGK